jgi:prophage regulatory protein
MSITPHPTTSVPRLLRLPTVLDRVGLRRSLIYEMMADGRFPAPVKLSGRAVAWPSDEIDTWIAERIAARDSGVTS